MQFRDSAALTQSAQPSEESAALEFRGQPFRSPKLFRDGTHRTQDPAKTLATIQPYLKAAGVTRVADVTGLDHVGVPTTLALRPNAPTMACSSGKGVTADQAYVSGVMEALELHAAESADLRPIRASYRDLQNSYKMPDVENLLLAKNSLFTVDWPFNWCIGWDVLSNSEVPVPMALVGMARNAMAGSMRAFQASSNGLGAGNTFVEAVTAAIYEIIERDGIACHRYAAVNRRHPIPILPEEALRTYPLVAWVLDKCDRAAVRVVVQECVVDTEVPIYDAFVYDTVDRGVPVTHGFGAHLDPSIAILRAVTEALQARLNFIAGSRDDLFRSAYSRSRLGWHETTRILEAMSDSDWPVANLRPCGAGDSFEHDVNELLGRVKSVDLPNVIVFDITPEGFPVSIVRVVIPGMEGYLHHGYKPGRRAMSFEGSARV